MPAGSRSSSRRAPTPTTGPPSRSSSASTASSSPAASTYGNHPVRTVAGTRLAAILGEEADVPSYHHQSVLTHPGYEASAWADDGTLEAMEDPDAFFRLAVQWHPEVGTDPRLFRALVEA